MERLRFIAIALGAGGLLLLIFRPPLGLVLLFCAAMFGGYTYFVGRELETRRESLVESRSGNEQVLLDLERDGLVSAAEAHELRMRWIRGPDGDLAAVTDWRRSRQWVTPTQAVALLGVLFGVVGLLTGSGIGIAVLLISVPMLVVATVKKGRREPIDDPEFGEAASILTRKVRIRQPVDANGFSESLRRLRQQLDSGSITVAEYDARRKRIIYP